ncbi:MAG: mannose-6-phosphate isomerase, partial [Spirochaetes bacterium]
RFTGIEQPQDKPGAEAWMGSHPDLSSEILDPQGRLRRLSEYIHEQPMSALGEEIFVEYGELPFLFKVLSASMPLSIQVHPDLLKARDGFKRENLKGIPRAAPDRNYRDSNHKPELALALSPFRALCGFRPLEETARLLGPKLSTLLAFDPSRGSETLKSLLSSTLRLKEKERLNLETLALERARELAISTEPNEKDAGATIHLCYSHYPHDPGAMAPFFLQILNLEPGQALYVPAGVMHAYLSGTILEVMATSDNVIRGGLTQKHMDIDALLSVIDVNAHPARVVPNLEDPFLVWRTPAKEFCLRRFENQKAGSASLGGGTPTILLCTQGSFVLHRPSPMNRSWMENERLEINRGSSAFVSASCGEFVVEGQGTLYIASPGSQ